MREVWIVPRDKKAKAEEILKKDDLISRQSIAVRDATTLGFDEEGFFIIIDGNDESIKKVNELLKDFGKKYEKKDDVLKKFDELEDAAASGFGFIMGE